MKNLLFDNAKQKLTNKECVFKVKHLSLPAKPLKNVPMCC